MANIQISNKDILISVVLLAMIYLTGILFYSHVEGWSYVDSAYFITATITTIGYGDLVPKTDFGKIFTIVLAFSGISLAFFIISAIASYRQKTIEKKLAKKLPISKPKKLK